MSRFREELKVISRRVWSFAIAIGFGLPLVIFGYILLFAEPAAEMQRRYIAFQVAIAILVSVFLFSYVLILGYIYSDAKRRAMHPFLWLLLAALVPNAIGIVLYFILRQPIVQACPKCGLNSRRGLSFCPACGSALGPVCPQCKSAVEPGWSHCAHCGCVLSASPEIR